MTIISTRASGDIKSMATVARAGSALGMISLGGEVGQPNRAQS